MLVLLVLFVSPSLQLEPDSITPQRVLLRSLRAMDHATRTSFVAKDYQMRTGPFGKVLFLAVDGTVYVEEPADLHVAFRSFEVFALAINPPEQLADKLDTGSIFDGCGVSLDGCTMVKFDSRRDYQEEGKLGCFLIIFMIFLLSFGSWMFTGEHCPRSLNSLKGPTAPSPPQCAPLLAMGAADMLCCVCLSLCRQWSRRSSRWSPSSASWRWWTSLTTASTRLNATAICTTSRWTAHHRPTPTTTTTMTEALTSRRAFLRRRC